MAGEYGVELFCLTDHDTVRGFAATRDALPGCEVLRGLELSCEDDGRTVHLLMYGVEDGEGFDALQAQLETVELSRRQRLQKIVERLAQLGIALDGEALAAATRNKTPGRPHVAQAMVAAGAVRSVREAFDRYLHDGGPADVEVERISLDHGLALGQACGARMSLAHPHTLRDERRVADLYQRMRERGLEGIEAVYGGYTSAQRRRWLELAGRLDLVVTAGSDFHGSVLPELKTPGIELLEPHATRLREWLSR